MLGFVFNTKTNLPGATKMRKKIVLDNDDVQKGQITTWDALATKLEAIDKVGMVRLSNLM